MHALVEELVGNRKVKVQRFSEQGIFDAKMLKEEQVAKIEDLQTRIALLKQAGLESAARQEEGELAYYRYCLKNAEARQEEDFGVCLTGQQEKILFTRFPVVYQWGWHSRCGDLVEHHIKKYGRGEESSWVYHLGDGAGDASYTAMCWSAYTFESIPSSIIRKIVALQKDPIVRSLDIMAPKQAITDPVLVADCYKIGRRLIARWGEALQPIPGIDS